MKKVTSLFMLLLLSWNSLFGQIENYYSVSEEIIPYAPLVGADETVLTPFTYSNLSIPFDFEYAGKTLGSMFFKNNGYLVLSGGTVAPQPHDITAIGQQSSGATSILAPLWDYSLSVPSDNINSKRKTLLLGVAPNRTFTVEWENVLWGMTGSEVSFRIIFEETTNNITFHYGPSLSTEDVSASIGMNTEFSDTLSFLSVTPGAAPLASSTVGNNSVSSTDYPSEGTSYVFAYTSPTCLIPAFLSIENSTLTPESVEVKWVSSDSETAWEILLKDLSGVTSEVVSVNSNPFLLDNLNENSDYSISIRAVCSALDSSEYSAQTFFTTPAICPKPLSLNETAIDLTTGSFAWEAGDAETLWEVAIALLGDPEPISGLELNVTNYDTTGLIKDTDYVLYVRANCGSTDGLSEWSALNFRTAATCIAPSNVVISNETCNTADVDWTSNGSETLWEVLVESFNGDQVITNTTEKPFTITNLISGRSVRVFISAICSPTDKSRPSARTFASALPDVTNPEAFCVAPFEIQLDDTGVASIDVTDINDNSSDDCEIQSINVDKLVFDINDIGENTVTLTVIDASNNLSSCTTIVTVLEADDSFIIEDYVTNLDIPRGLDFDDSGILYVAEYTSGDVLKVTASETYTEFSNTGFRNNNIVFNSEGNLLTTDDFFSQIFEVNTIGATNLYTALPSNSSPYGIAFNSVGDLFVSFTTQGKIVKIAQDLTITDYAIGFFQPEGIVFDSNDNLYVADRGDRKLFKIDDQGVKTTIASSVVTIRAVAVDSQDNIYYNNSPSNPSLPMQVMKYDPVSNTSSILAEKQNQGSSTLLVNELEFDNAGNLFIAYENQVGIIRNVDLGPLSVNDVSINNRILINTVINNNELRFTEHVNSIEVYNLSGASVYSSKEFNNKFILPTLNTGIYILKIKDINNSILIEKIIEQ